MEKHILNLQIAIEAIIANKFRALLTALGVIFGVSSVIAMLSIGAGAKQEILEQMELIGVNNIVIRAIEKDDSENTEEDTKTKAKFSPGLNLRDLESVKEVIPNLEFISPLISMKVNLMNDGNREKSELLGVDNSYFQISNFKTSSGNFFNDEQITRGLSVCVIGDEIRAKLFPSKNPVGKRLKCGKKWLTVVGVIQRRDVSGEAMSNLGVREYNKSVFIPYQTMLLKFKNRSLVTKSRIDAMESQDDEDESANKAKKDESIHQLNEIIIKVKNSENLTKVSDMLKLMFKRRHFEVEDVEVFVPELLLKQQQRTKDIFNFVLGAIAGISLLVGGIGIMNIMLASVYERIKEIGLRISLGAKKSDIILQFVYEAVLISMSGGIIGIILGVSISYAVSFFTDIKTIITAFSIIISFGVAFGTGLLFGITPARKAANQDPITSLRHE